MIRKTIFGLVAATALATAAFAPTAASAAYFGYGYGSDFSSYDSYKPFSGYSYGHRSQGYFY
jgi:hypothetical protein